MFAGKKSAQIREILISESAWEEMTCLFAPSLGTDGFPVFDDTLTMTLAEPLDGITEIKVSYNRGLSGGVVRDSIEGGYRGGFLVTLLTLDMTKRWNPNKSAWIPTKG